MADDPKTLVSTDWLAQHLKDPALRILDASWYLRASLPDFCHLGAARFGRFMCERGGASSNRIIDTTK